MNSCSIFYINIIFITFFFSITEIKAINIIEINDTKIEGIIEETYSFKEAGEAYFLYLIPNNDNLLFTIYSTGVRALTINCVFSSSNDDETIQSDLNDINKNVCNTFYNEDLSSTLRMYNVIPSFEGYEPGSNLFIKIKTNKKTDITFFVRKEGSFLNPIESKTYSNSFAHYVFEFNPINYISNEYLLTSSEANSIFIFGDKNKTIESIDETSAFVINEQSLSAHFWEYDKIYIFIGKKEYKSDEENYDIKINNKTYNDNKEKLYYYIPNMNAGFLSFYYHCSDESTNHYLIVNYGNLDKKTYYYKFHNLIGSKSSLAAVLPLGDVDIKNLEYLQLKRFNYLNITDSHLQVLKFQCSGNDNKINVNIKYSKMPLPSNIGLSSDEITKDFLHDFGEKYSFSIDYSSILSNEFALEIFTPDNENVIDFNVTFEGNLYIINNKNIFMFKITDKNQESLTIEQEQNISAIISISPSYKKTNDILNYNYYFVNDLYYYYYQINHEFNANYSVEFNVEYGGKEGTSLFSLCYFLTSTALIQNTGQNCILVPTKNKYYLKLKNIFKYDKNIVDFNKEEPNYHLVVYSNNYFSFNVNFTTDLQKSTPIDKKYNRQEFIYLNADLVENKDSYFNIPMDSKLKEKYFDIYILSETDEIEDELKFEIKCIMKYELAINFIEQYFTDENNRCLIINKFDYNSNVYHILFNATKDDYNDNFIIKISPKKNMKIKFVYNENYIIEKFKIQDEITKFEEQSVYRIFELDESSFSSIKYKNVLFFDRDINGIELYARKNKDFLQIFKGSFFIFDPKEIKNKYNNYDKILFVYGKNDCEDYCKTTSYYQIKLLQYFSYIQIPEFNGYYRIPVSINDCVKGEPYYILFDYGKEYKKEKLSIARVLFEGNIVLPSYIDIFTNQNFEEYLFNFENYKKLEENSLHLSVIKFQCLNNIFGYFDYFTKIDYSKEEIKLNPGSLKHYIIQNNTKFTFNYESINEIKINLLLNEKDEKELTINFEDREIKLNTNKNSINLIRQVNDTNSFDLTAPFTMDVPILITTLINVKELPKTNISDLYQYEDEFIYNIQPNTINITFVIQRNNPGSRLLLEEEEGNENEIKICYNVAKMILLEKNEVNCFYVKDRYDLLYNVPVGGEEDYLVFYPIDQNEKIDIIKIIPTNEKEKGDNNNQNEGENEDKKKDKGLSGFVIFLIILLVLIIIAVVVLLVIKYTKKTVTSEDIEKNIKTPSPIIN